MLSNSLCLAVAALAGLGACASQGVIVDDAYFYGQSPPVYPSPQSSGSGAWASAYTKAKHFVTQLTLEEKVNLTGGVSSNTGCSGFIPAITRLGFPGLCLTDAGNGVRNTDYVSSWPSGLHVGASWNKDLALKRGQALGKEARKKGVNTLLGPVVGPAFRVAESGRNWEGFAADPYLAGALVAESVSGLQESGVMACVKHYIANEQETNRNPSGNISAVSSNVDDATMHEFYLWPFQDAVHAGAASIMCSYNRLNNSYACQNSKTLNGLLKDELGFQGFVVSDWGALHAGYAAAAAGLDVVMPRGASHFGSYLVQSVTNGSLAATRVDDMAIRVIASWYLLGQDAAIPAPGAGMPKSLAVPHTAVDARDPADRALLLQGAVEGHVLVKNNGALPLRKPRLLYVAGYSAKDPDATSPVLSSYWGGTESVGAGGQNPAAALNGTIVSGGGSGATAQSAISSPFHALVTRALADGTQLFWDFLAAAPAADAAADACLVFGNAWATEGNDRPGVRDTYTDNLIRSVADACANTVVVLHNAGVRLVDAWIDHANVSAVVFAHLPGQASGDALVRLLYGDDNFSGRLPYSVPRAEADYGALLSPSLPAGDYAYFPQSDFDEGVFVDYRRFDREGIAPRFAFGFGLGYTTFAYSGLRVSPEGRSGRKSAYPTRAVAPGGAADLWDVVARVTVAVTNTGAVAGQEVAQLYVGLPGSGGASGTPVRQLRGFEKTALLAPRASATVTFALTRRDLSVWDAAAQKWKLQAGAYTVGVGSNSRSLAVHGTLTLSVK